MTEKTKQKRPPLYRLLRTFIKWAMILIFATVLLLLSIPTILSTPPGKRIIQTAATRILHREVSVGSFSWSWLGGLRIQDLSVADAPRFSKTPLLTADRIWIDLDPTALLQNTAAFSLRLHGFKGRLIVDKNGNTNLEALLGKSESKPGETKPAPSDETATLPELTLPLETTLDLQVKDASITATDRRRNETAALTGVTFRVNAPSLLHKPLTVSVSARPRAAQKTLPPVDIHLVAGPFFDSKKQLDLTKSELQLTGDLPGISLRFTGEAQDRRASGHMTIDFDRLFEVAAPFLPAFLPPVTPRGKITAEVSAEGQYPKPVQFHTEFTGNALSIKLGGLGSLGNLDFTAIHRGRVDWNQQTADVESGRIEIPDTLRIGWSGKAQKLAGGKPDITLFVEEFFADLGALLKTAAPFLPQGLLVSPGHGKPAAFRLQKAHIQASMETGDGDLSVKSLSLAIPTFMLKQRGIRFQTSNLRLALSDGQAKITGFFPAALQTKGTVELGRIGVENPLSLVLSDLTIPDFTLDAKNLFSDSSLRIGEAKVTAALSAGAVDLEGQQGAALEDLEIARFQFSASEVFDTNQPRLKSLDLSADLSLKNLRLPVGGLSDFRATGVFLKAADVFQNGVPTPKRLDSGGGMEARNVRMTGGGKYSLRRLVLEDFAATVEGADDAAAPALEKASMQGAIRMEGLAGEGPVDFSFPEIDISNLQMDAKGATSSPAVDSFSIRADIGLSEASVRTADSAVSLDSVSLPGIYLEAGGGWMEQKPVVDHLRFETGLTFTGLAAAGPGLTKPWESTLDRLHAAGIVVSLSELTAAAGAPSLESFLISTDLTLSGLAVKGDTDLQLQNFSLPRFHFTADDLFKNGVLRISKAAMNTGLSFEGLSLEAKGAEASVTRCSLSDVNFRAVDLFPSSTTETPAGRIEMSAGVSTETIGVVKPVSVDMRRFSIPKFTLRIDAPSFTPPFLPRTVMLDTALSLSGLRVGGTGDTKNAALGLNAFTLNSLKVSATPEATSAAAPLGVAFSADLTESLSMEGISVSPLVVIDRIEQSADLSVESPEGNHLAGALETFSLALSNVQVTHDMLGNLATDAEINAGVDRFQVHSVSPPGGDVSGARLSMKAGDLATLTADADLTDFGRKRLSTNGSLNVNLSRIPEKIVRATGPSTEVTGNLDATWRFSGRLPRKEEIDALSAKPLPDLTQDLPFLSEVDVSVAAGGIGAKLTLPGGAEVDISEIQTTAPLRYAFRKGGEGNLSTEVTVGNVSRLPGLGRPTPPVGFHFNLSAEHSGINTASITQSLKLAKSNISEELQFSISNLRRLIPALTTAPQDLSFVNDIAASGKWKLEIPESADVTALARVSDQLDFTGNVSMETEFSLTPKESIGGRFHLRAENVDAGLKETARVKGLFLNLDLQKEYALIQNGAPETDTRKRLSQAVIGGGADTERIQTSDPTVRRFFGELQKRQTPRRTVHFSEAELGTLPFPLRVSDTTIDFDLRGGIPIVDYFQSTLLGGTVIGSLGVVAENGEFQFLLRLRFTGIDTERALPGAMQGSDNTRNTEISGYVTTQVPLTTQLTDLLENLQFELYFHDIGQNALERMLYALDPYESNESIVAQRRLLQTGTPRWFRFAVKNGFLSVTGEVEAKGVRLDLPQVDGVHVAGISGLDFIAEKLVLLKPVIEALRIFSAGKLAFDDTGGPVFLP